MKSRAIGSRLTRNARDNVAYYTMMLIPIALIIIFSYLPMYGIIIAFQKYVPGRPFIGPKVEWVGLKWFKDFVGSFYFKRILRNTIRLNLMTLILGFPIPIIFALVLNELRLEKFKKFTQTVSYMPYFLSAVIIAGMVLSFTNVSGFITKFAQSLGYKGQAIILDKQAFPWVFVLTDIWAHFGWSSILYLSNITSVDPALYEAAELDGATRVQRIWHVTLPNLLPLIMIQLILRIGSLLGSSTEMILLMSNTATYETADVIGTFLYRENLMKGQFSYGTAAGLLISVMNLILLIIGNTIARKTTEYSLW